MLTWNERQRKEGIGIGTALPCLAPFLRVLPCMDSYQALPLDFPSGRLRALSSINKGFEQFNGRSPSLEGTALS